MKNKINRMDEYMEKLLKQKMNQIQEKYDFIIPDYVLEEISYGNKEKISAL